MPIRRRKVAKKAPRHRRRPGGRAQKRKRNQVSTVRVKHGSFIPDRTFVKLKYTENILDLLSSPASGFGFIQWRFNAMFDVSSNVGTYQPVGFSVYASMYDRYWVRGSKCDFEFSNMEDFPVMVVLWPSAPVVGPSVNANFLQSMISNTYSRHMVLSAKGGMDRGRLSMYISSRKLVGDKSAGTDTFYAAQTTTNPSRLLYWNVGVYPLNSLDTFTSANVLFEFRMTHYTEFYDRKEFSMLTTGIDLDESGNVV